MKLLTVVATAFVLNDGVVSVYGVDRMSESDQGPSTGPLIAQMGTPEPGSVSDQETTRKQRNPAKAQGTDQNTQVTLGGAKNVEDRSPSIETLMTEKAKAIAPADLHPEGSGEQTASAPARSAPEEQVKGEVIRGKIVTIQNEFLAVKTTNGKDVRLHVDKNTHRGQVNLKDEEFKEGDKIEAYVTQKGHAISISLMRHRGICPGTPKEGDDMDLML
jgi:hypothetical protein